MAEEGRDTRSASPSPADAEDPVEILLHAVEEVEENDDDDVVDHAGMIDAAQALVQLSAGDYRVSNEHSALEEDDDLIPGAQFDEALSVEDQADDQELDEEGADDDDLAQNVTAADLANADHVGVDATPAEVTQWATVPKPQPLRYWVPADANGGVKLKALAFSIDYTASAATITADVKKAKKARLLTINRAKKPLNLPGRRDSTLMRGYSDENRQWIADEYDNYANANNGLRMSMDELYMRYNQQFPHENRTKASLDSHMRLHSWLLAKRNSFPTA